MKIRKYLPILVAGVIFLLTVIGIVLFRNLSGEAQLNRYTATFLDVFDTRTEIVGFAKNKEEFAGDAQLIKDRLIYYNQLYDIYNDYPGVNNIKTINDNAGIAPVEVDPEIIALLQFSIDTYYETDGAVNVALGSVLKLWHRQRELGIADPERAKLPDEEALIEASKHTDITCVVIDTDNNTVFLTDPDMSLDVGSTGKGYAVQRVMEYAREKGLNNILLSLGGNISCIGTRIDGTNFTLGIQNPDMDSEETYIEMVDINDGECVVSSGDYQRYYEVDGVRYCHIIDPQTLYPSDEFAAVSVITDDSGAADSYSTGLYTMSLEEGQAFVKNHDNVEAMWVMHDGSKIYSEGFKEKYVR
jgi:thiamine biosynthesis lipoprotein